MLKKGMTVYTAFSEYTVEKQIGQGGNGTVFLVHDQNRKRFALKAIDRNRTNSDKLKRFKNEIAFCENNDNPHVVKVLDHGTYSTDDANLIFYIMPVYDQTLRGLMDDGIAAEKILPIITQILFGLRYAHEKGVWHRDIKPENILIDRQGSIVIADFGIAHFSPDNLVTKVETKRLDRLANFQYAAPEQRVIGGEVNGRADIYAVGLILNEMFTKTIAVGSNYKKIGDVNHEYAWIDPVVDLMLQQSPDDRPYPVSTVSTRILAAQKEWQQSKELQRLAEEKPSCDGPYQMGVPTIRDWEYEKGELRVYLDGVGYYWFEVWFEILQRADYGHSELMGYEPRRLKRYPPDCIAMPIVMSQENTLKKVASNIKDWIKKATLKFNEERRAEYIQEEKERQQRIEAEIRRLRKEAEMRSAVKGLFD